MAERKKHEEMSDAKNRNETYNYYSPRALGTTYGVDTLHTPQYPSTPNWMRNKVFLLRARCRRRNDI